MPIPGNLGHEVKSEGGAVGGAYLKVVGDILHLLQREAVPMAGIPVAGFLLIFKGGDLQLVLPAVFQKFHSGNVDADIIVALG